MNAHTAKSNFAFRLPSLSYIDAKWEEPELRQPTRPALRRRTFADWLAARVSAVKAWARTTASAAELASMTDRELQDIGLNRSDLNRVFRAELSADLRLRGLRG